MPASACVCVSVTCACRRVSLCGRASRHLCPSVRCGPRTDIWRSVTPAGSPTQPADHERPPRPGGLQAPQLQDRKASRESPGTLRVKGSWEPPAGGAIMEGFVDYFQTTSGTTCVHAHVHSQCLCAGPHNCLALLPDSWKQPISRPPEACRALCAPWFTVEGAPVRPSGPQKPPFSLPRSQLSMGNPGARPGSAACLGSWQGRGPAAEARGWRLPVSPTLQKPVASEQRPELPRCLSGFANLSSLAQVREGSEFLFPGGEKGSLCWRYLCFSPDFHFICSG